MARLRPIRFARRGAFPLFGALWLAGWIVGERRPPWLWLYFIPAPVVLIGGLVDLVVCRHEWRRWRTASVVLLTLLAAWKTLGLDMRWHLTKGPDADATIRIVHWNIAHAPFGYLSVFKHLRKDRPDVVILSESSHGRYWADWGFNELGLPFAFHDQGMTLLSRFDFEPQGTIPMPNARAWRARLALPDGPLDLVLIDVLSHPTLDRRVAIDPLAKWIAQREAKVPLLLVGDFNTPRDARSLRPLRRLLRHAYEAAGYGWPYSWPLPMPVYSLDHTWVSDQIVVQRYRLRGAPISDHRRQVLSIAIDRRTPARAD